MDPVITSALMPRLRAADLVDALREIADSRTAPPPPLASPDGRSGSIDVEAVHLRAWVSRLQSIAGVALQGFNMTDARAVRVRYDNALRTISQLREGRALARAQIKGLRLQLKWVVRQRDALRTEAIAARREIEALRAWLTSAAAHATAATPAALEVAVRHGGHLRWAAETGQMPDFTARATTAIDHAANHAQDRS